MRSRLLFAAAMLTGFAAQAHVTLDPAVATAGSTYKAVLRVGHGCEGGLATKALVVRLPEGFTGAKPVPKPGWRIALQRDAATQAVTEISWTAKTADDELDDAFYDEFTVRGRLPAQAGPLWFKVRQVCNGVTADWSQTPAGGSSTAGLKSPAALLDVQPATNTETPHHH